MFYWAWTLHLQKSTSTEGAVNIWIWQSPYKWIFFHFTFICNLLFLLINFWIACGSIDFPYFDSSLSNGFEYNNDLNRLCGFSSGFLGSVFILEHILRKFEAVILPQRCSNQSFEDACPFAKFFRCSIWFFKTFSDLVNSTTFVEEYLIHYKYIYFSIVS